jgi:hypothetical protein
VERWENEKGEIEAKIAGIESFQKLVLEQPDDVILEFVKDVRDHSKNNTAGNNLVAERVGKT